MAKRKPDIFVDAMVPTQIVHKLRRLGYDAETVQQYQGTSEPAAGLSDEIVLQVASLRRRVLLTLNDKDFRKLHWSTRGHHGIIICNETQDYLKRAKEIDDAIKSNAPLARKLIDIPPKAAR